MDINAANILLAAAGAQSKVFFKDFGQPVTGIAADETHVYVCSANRIGKYTHAGVKVWLKQISTDLGLLSVALSPNGNIVALGGSSSSDYMHVAVWNPEGVSQGATRLGVASGSGLILPKGIATSSANDIFVCGSTNRLSSYTGNYAAYVARFNSAGALTSQTLFAQGSFNSGFSAIAIDGGGSLILGGFANGNALAAKMTQSYGFSWQKSVSSSFFEFTGVAVLGTSCLFVGNDLGLGVVNLFTTGGGLTASARNSSVSGPYSISTSSDKIFVSAANSYIANVLSSVTSTSAVWQNKINPGIITRITATSKSIFAASSTSNYFAKLPADGTGLGSYAQGSYAYTASTDSLVATSLSVANSSYTTASLSYSATQFTISDSYI